MTRETRADDESNALRKATARAGLSRGRDEASYAAARGAEPAGIRDKASSPLGEDTTPRGMRGGASTPADTGRSHDGARDAAPRRLFPILNMSLAMLLVGTTAPLGELALAGMPLFPVLALRLALAGAALTVLGAVGTQGARLHAALHDARKRGHRTQSEQKRLSRRDWLALTLQAFCGVIVFNAGMWLGMRESSPAAAGIFTSATPAVMVLIGALAFGEPPGMRALCGVCLTVAGVLAARGAGGGGWTPGAGDLLLCAAVAGESVFLLALKWLPGWLTPLDAARRITWIGLALTLPPALWQGAGFDWSGVGLTAWAAVVALGVLVTAGGYVLWFRGVARASASQAAAVTGLLPVSAVLSSWLLLGEAVTMGQALGCLAVGAGIWLAESGGADDALTSDSEKNDHPAQAPGSQVKVNTR